MFPSQFGFSVSKSEKSKTCSAEAIQCLARLLNMEYIQYLYIIFVLDFLFYHQHAISSIGNMEKSYYVALLLLQSYRFDTSI